MRIKKEEDSKTRMDEIYLKLMNLPKTSMTPLALPEL